MRVPISPWDIVQSGGACRYYDSYSSLCLFFWNDFLGRTFVGCRPHYWSIRWSLPVDSYRRASRWDSFAIIILEIRVQISEFFEIRVRLSRANADHLLCLQRKIEQRGACLSALWTAIFSGLEHVPIGLIRCSQTHIRHHRACPGDLDSHGTAVPRASRLPGQPSPPWRLARQ